MCKESTKMVAKETIFLNLTDNSYMAGNVYINVTLRHFHYNFHLKHFSF